MKKTIAFLALIMLFVLAMAESVGAYTQTVPAEADVTVGTAVNADTTASQYFAATPQEDSVDLAEDAFTNVDVDGDRMLKYVSDGGSFRFRIFFDSNRTGNGAANIVGYSRLRIRIKTSASVKATLNIDEMSANGTLDRYWAVDMEGNIVATAGNYQGVTLPAGFDGYLYADITGYTWVKTATHSSRRKDDPTPIRAGYNTAPFLDPVSVSRSDNTWTLAAGTEIYFGEIDLVRENLLDVSVHPAPENLHFVLMDSTDSFSGGLCMAYKGRGSAEDSATVITNGKDKAFKYTLAAGDTHITRFSLPNTKRLYSANFNTNPIGFGCYIKTAAKPVTIQQLLIDNHIESGSYFLVLYDMEGNRVAYGTGGVAVPAEFEGFLCQFSDSSYDYNWGFNLGFLAYITGEEGAEIIFDDFGYYESEAEAYLGSNPVSNLLHFEVTNSVEGLTDLSAQVFSYTETAPYNTTGALTDADDNKSLQVTWNKAAYAITKLDLSNGKTVAAMDSGAYGFGYYVETGALPVELWQTQIPDSDTLYDVATLYDVNGLCCGTVGQGSGADTKTIPAEFKGYVCYTFEENKAIDFSNVMIWAKGAVGATLTVDNFGYYTACPSQVNMLGVQFSKVTENRYSVRFVIGLDSLDYQNLSFRYQADIAGEQHWADYQTAAITSVYTTIHVDGIGDVTAEELGYRYITALTIEDVPADYLINLYVYVSATSEACPTVTTVTPIYRAAFDHGSYTEFTIVH